MWPFDKFLQERLRDLERSFDAVSGANSVLQAQLDKAEHRANILQEKLFDMTGINKSNRGERSEPPSHVPITLGNKTASWAKIKEDLEMKTKREYWEKKAQESRERQEVADLEEKILGDNNASKES